MKRESGSNATKEKIREAAITLFKENGYENVTVVQICEAANITKRTFYYHFESKDELLAGITDSLGVQAEQLLGTLVSQRTNMGMLWELMQVYSINSVRFGPNLIKQIYINMLKNGEEKKFPEDMYLYNTVVRTIINAQNAGELKNKSAAEDLTYALYHSFRSITITWASENGAFDIVQSFRRAFDAVFDIRSGGQETDGTSDN